MPEQPGGRLRWITLEDQQLVALTLVIKLALLGFGVLAFALILGRLPANGIHGMFEIWDRWDAPHYIDLAVLGYRATDPGVTSFEGYRRAFPGDLPLYIVFFPLFPWLTGSVDLLLHDPLISAFIVATVASVFVAPLLYRLVEADLGHEVAMRAAWFGLVFPTAYFLHIGYTESVFLALVLGSFLAARRRQWWFAGLFGAFAALARVNGLLLLPALAVEAWSAWESDPERRVRVEWAAIGLVLAGFAGYLALNEVVYGDPLTFLRIQQEHWFKSLALPWQGIGDVVRSALHGDSRGWLGGWAELAFIALGAAGTVVSIVRFRASWSVWMVTNWLLFTSTSFVLSVPRYTLTLFPLFAWFGLLGRRRGILVGLSLVSLALMGYFASQFAIGQWGF